MVRNHILWTRDLLHTLARIRIDLSTQTEDKVSGSNHGFGEVSGIFDHRNPGQIVAVADKVFGDGGTVATRHAVAPYPSFFQMRRENGKNIAVPFSSGEPHGRMQRIIGRMR